MSKTGKCLAIIVTGLVLAMHLGCEAKKVMPTESSDVPTQAPKNELPPPPPPVQ